MTQEEKRIAIARTCGFLDVFKGSRNGKRHENGATLWGSKEPETANYSRTYVVLPDYFNDLNAMYDAEEFIGGPTDYRWCGYMTHLDDVVGRRTGSRTHASASQRAEAFGRANSLWKEGE